MEKGLELLQNERAKQIKKGYTLHNDLKYIAGELVDAAICYLWIDDDMVNIDVIYPWAKSTFKPSENVDSFVSRKENIMKAGAMIVAQLNVMQHLIDTRELLSQDHPDIEGKTSYFILAGNYYFGKIEKLTLLGDDIVATINEIKYLHGSEEDAAFPSIDLEVCSIWTVI